MNELIFFCHIFVVVILLLISFKIGKIFLTSCIAFQAVLANLFVIKQITLFHCSVTCSDVFSVGSLLGLVLLQEYFGEKASNEAIFLTFFFLLFFLIMGQLHISYIPSLIDSSQKSFSTIFSSSPRVILTSIFSFFVMQKFSLWFHAFLTKNWSSFKGKIIVTTIAAQILDTLLFTIIGLYGIVASLWDVFLISTAVKIITVLLSGLFLISVKKFILPRSYGSFFI